MAKLTATAGLAKKYNSTPLSMTMDSYADLIDGVLYSTENALLTFNYNTSFGLDFGENASVGSIKIYFKPCMNIGTLKTITGWDSTNPDANKFRVYSSDDNSIWTFVEEIYQPPIGDIALGEASLTLTLNNPVTARYIKVYLPYGAQFLYI